MLPKKREHPKEKPKLHPRNKHRERYDFKVLVTALPELAPFVRLNIYEDESIDFFDPEAVKMLNKALLKHFYGIDHWNIPPNYLCPPIPGRADYIHYVADLLCSKNFGKFPRGPEIKCLDIGVGANCIYPIIGNREYGWSFTGTDIDPVALESANKIIELNPLLKESVELKLQIQPNDIFFGIMKKDDLFDISLCNPPFHTSAAEALESTNKKLTNLKQEKSPGTILNFGGQTNELWCKGGEEKFIRDMIRQSKLFSASCFWFSSLVSKQTHLKSIYAALEKTGTVETRTIPMGQGNKSSRIVAWTFLTKEQQKDWAKIRWSQAF